MISYSHLPALVELLAEKTRQAIALDDLDTALGSVMAIAMQAGICDQASITERTPVGTWTTTAPSDEVAVTADKMQYVLAEGPGVAAAYENDLLTSSDVAADPRWPQWGPQAANLGIRSVISVPLYTDRDVMGALNLYSTAERGYPDSHKDTARLIGTHVSVALAYFRGQAHLWRAIEARHDIGVAQGILMQQYRIDPEQAFGVLRRISQAENVKLHVVAARIVAVGHLAAAVPDLAQPDLQR